MILLPQPRSFWMPPSQRADFDPFTRDAIKYVWRLTAKLDDGHIVWRGWFEDREDADEFITSIVEGTLLYERALWDLPSPVWRPDLGEHVQYEFATQVFLTGTTGSNQTYTVASDWNSSNNFCDSIGAGGSGGIAWTAPGTNSAGTGGGGGAVSRQPNVTLTPSGSATYQLGTGGTAVTRNGAGTLSGNAGGDTWFNATTLGASSVGAKGGSGGLGSVTTTVNGGAGGVASSGIGTTKHNGGNGGNCTGSPLGDSATGGGSSATLIADGNNAANAASGVLTAGASVPSGATGGTTGLNGSPGGNGTEYDASHGFGAGGGAAGAPSGTSASTGGNGGNYGGGGGGDSLQATSTPASTSGAGIKGMIALTYTPSTVFGGNIPLLGL